MNDIATYNIQGVKLDIPNEMLTSTIKKAFDSGKYEHLEARQIPRIFRDGDRLLEFGAGVGYLSALAAAHCKLEECVAVEANPKLIEVIRSTHVLNRVKSKVINGVALSRIGRRKLGEVKDNVVSFYITENFWGASLEPKAGYISCISVPILDVQELIDDFKPTIIICDIEGGEVDLFNRVDLSCVRTVLLEVHKGSIGLRGIDTMAMDLRGEGLYYDPDYSVGAVVVYSRSE